MDRIRLATEQEEKNIVGSSFHNVRFNASVDELTKILGEENIGASGDDKCKHEWFVKDEETNQFFSIYDWKEYRVYPDDEIVTWHIGSKLTSTQENAFADKLKKALSELRKEEQLS